MKRTFEFDGSNGVGESMAQVLIFYPEAAYPMGGSDCAAASCGVLQSIVDKLVSSEEAPKVSMTPEMYGFFYHNYNINFL